MGLHVYVFVMFFVNFSFKTFLVCYYFFKIFEESLHKIRSVSFSITIGAFTFNWIY